MQKEGYDGLSSDMEKLLEDTEYEVIHNAEKQQSVIKSMLQNVVNMYESAYGKINQIIGDTGWVGSGDFNKNQSDLGTQDGASSQVGDALKKPPQFKPSDDASGVVTDPIKDNGQINSGIEDEIMQKPNTDNRLCGELKIDKTSVTLEEGKSISVTVSIRPNDAKNKTVKWVSSNTSIVTVSSGTIKAIKPGSCQVTVSTTDGSGLSKTVSVTVTKKPDPPKPNPPANNNSNSGGDGVPNVGDAVIFDNGCYYYDSQGTSPAGKQMLGQTVYITRINTRQWATKPYHISRTSKFGERDLGWVSLKQLRGYETGKKMFQDEEYAWMDEGSNGKSAPETIVRRSDGAILTRFKPKDGVLTNENTENIFKWAKFSPEKFISANKTTPNLSNVTPVSQNVEINLHYDNLLNIDGGTITKDSIPEINEFLKKSCEYTTQHITKELQKAGFAKRW